MSDNEQRCAIKFCFRLGHNATETFAKLQQAYLESVLSRAQVFRWFKAFSEGRQSIEDEPRSRRPSVSKTAENVVRVRDLVRSDRPLTNHLKGHHFGTLENIQTAVTDQLKAIPTSEFHQCYEEWKKRLQRCVASEGSYFEGDNVELHLNAPVGRHSWLGSGLLRPSLWIQSQPKSVDFHDAKNRQRPCRMIMRLLKDC
ncbi:HTH_48 domain-containing protein [Trichonephila clavipes]|nr:HTH_48 domain-containing protein [Trichonephila clavipes]